MSERYGHPLTEEERVARHLALTGEPTPPPRGTRKRLLAQEDQNLFIVLLLIHGGLLAVELYIAYKNGWLGI